MNAAQRHRGPDGVGAHVEGEVALGHRRLGIVDLTDAAAQPFWSPDRSVGLVYNGEIHNYLELATELRAAGVRLRTRSDTEVVLWAYRQWGEGCFERFNGMWAIALWEPRQSRLLLCRDRFGVKPLHYSVRGGRIAFASEAKAIIAAFPEERRIDQGMVRDFIGGGVPDSDRHSFFENIQSVDPGHLLEVTRKFIAQRKYWRFEPGVEQPRPHATEEFRELLLDAVRIRLRSDVPLGVALSGGVDSSTVTRLAALATTQPIHCFSLRNARADIDESHYAQLVANDPQRYVMHWITPPQDLLLDTVTRLTWHHDAPMSIRGRFPQWHLMQAAAREVKVLLDGQGADELLGGYERFVLPYALDRMNPLLPQRASRCALPRELLHLGRMSKGVHHLLPGLLRASLKTRLRSWLPRAISRGPNRETGALQSHRYYGAWDAHGVEQPFASRLNNALWFELRQAGLPELLHGEDASSMAFSLESRLPFLDHRIVELCFSLPFDEKIAAGWTKSLLRRAAAPLLPSQVCWRRDKLGFPADYAGIMGGRQSTEDIRGVLLDRRCRERGLMDSAWAASRIGAPDSQSRRWLLQNLDLVWKLLTLELWCRLFLDGESLVKA